MQPSETENDLRCLNCDHPLKPEDNFCPHCGQKAKDDLTLGVLFYNTISNYFSFDARFLKSFIPLMFKPGVIARHFVEGKRLQYLHPAQYYLFVSVLFFFVFSFTAREHTQAVDKAIKQGFDKGIVADTTPPQKVFDSTTAAKLTAPLKNPNIVTGMSDEEVKVIDSLVANAETNPGTRMDFGDWQPKKVDSLINAGASDDEIYVAMGMEEDAGFLKRRFYEQMLKFQKNRGGGILQAFYDSIPIALFFLLPIFALLLKLFYWRRARFAHHLVFAFYYFSFLFMVLTLVFGVNMFIEIPDSIDWLIVLSTYLYFLIAAINFYRQNWFLTWIKTGMITFIYLMMVIPISLGIMVFTSFLFY
ncbi:MAG: DUF3667 domain-containing protein [bacterium]